MRSIIHKIFFFILMAFSFLNIAQAALNSHIVIDRSHYTNGDVIRGIILFEQAKVDGKVIRATIYETSDKALVKSFFIKVIDNIAGFYLPVSGDIKPGNYFIQFHAVSINPEPVLHYIGSNNFTILDPNKINQFFLKSNKGNITKSLTSTQIKSKIQKQTLNLEGIDKENLKFICVIDTITDISVSTHDFPDWDQIFVDDWSSRLFLNMHFLGDKGGTNFKLLGLYSPIANRTFVAKSNNIGETFFFLDDFESLQNFQILYSKEENDSIEILNANKAYVDLVPNLVAIPKQVLQLNQIKSLVHNYYGVSQFVIDSFYQSKILSMSKPQKSFDVKNFKKFPNLESFFKENSLPIEFINSNGTISVRVYPNAFYTKQFESVWNHPLILVNEEVTEDYGKLMTLPMTEIDKIEIFYNTKELRKHFSAFGNNGLIKIYLQKNSKWKFNSPYSADVYGLLPKIKNQDDIVKKSILEGLPFLNTTSVWLNTLDIETSSKYPLNSTREPKFVYLFYLDENILDVKKLYAN